MDEKKMFTGIVDNPRTSCSLGIAGSDYTGEWQRLWVVFNNMNDELVNVDAPKSSLYNSPTHKGFDFRVIEHLLF